MDVESTCMGTRSEFLLEDNAKIDGNETLEFAGSFCRTVDCSTIPNCKRIGFFFQNPRLRRNLESWTQLCTAKDNNDLKNDSVRAAHRAKGISLFIKPDDAGKGPRLKKCLEHFNTALLHCSFTGEMDQVETSKLFATRSAVFRDLRRYDDALQDIEIALRLGYPFHHKVWVRKANILAEQGKFQEALEAVEFIERSLCVPVEELWRIENVKSIANKGVQNEDRFTEDEGHHRLPTGDLNRRRFNRRPFQENPTFRHASRRVRIAYDDERTRHVSATEDIEAGDILFDEIPFASILLPDAYSEYCYHCHSSLEGYIFPCKSCSEVKYCGETCSLESWGEYHSLECQKSVLLQNVGLCHLATRIVMRAGVDQVLHTVATNSDKGNHHKVQDSISYIQSKSSEDEKKLEYLRIYFLAEHSDKMAPIDMFTYAKTAAGVTNWLQTQTPFFNGRTDKEIWTVGGAILRHTCQLICNAQRVYAFRRNSEGIIVDYDREIIGSAIYASTSLMNHSCDPNISTNYKFGERQGRRLIVKATRKIPAGQEVMNSYGVTYQRHDFSSRISAMCQQYFFTCNCTHCKREKDGRNFVEGFESLLCANVSCRRPVYCSQEDPTQSFTCPNCATPVDMAKAESWLKKAHELHELGQEMNSTKEGHKILVDALAILQKQVVAGHRLIAELHDSLGKSFIDMAYPWKAVQHLKKSLDYVTSRFGTTSNEYGLELRKYAELLELLGLRADAATGRSTSELLEEALSCLENYFPSTD